MITHIDTLITILCSSIGGGVISEKCTKSKPVSYRFIKTNISTL